MKKLMITLLTSMMLFALPNAVWAEEETNTETDKDTTVQLYAEVGSEYTVKLPKKVNVKDKSVSFDVQAKGNISSDKKIAVAFSESALLKDANSTDGRQSISLTISNGTHDFLYTVLEPNYSNDAKFAVGVTHENDIPAGSWSVDLPVTIALVATN
ncbi:MAG: hypothetical protein Q4E33_04440 [Erysipelotrichaceae bacterium]|nr:hypothetical protein [Erysipelotrichaceae bacterium]